MAEFTTPAFLSGHSVEEVYALMRATLPTDIDSSEGSHVYNLLRPTAIVAAELCEFILPQVVRTIFPEWSSAEFLDAHATTRGLVRKPAVAASGALSITAGSVGITIPVGAKFSTVGTTDAPAVEYQTTEAATFTANQTKSVSVACSATGDKGNTPANTVILVADGRIGIASVTNPAAITGGADIESDASLIARILDYDQSRGTSFVGSPSDYRRWAQEASDEVGAVTVLSDTVSPAGTVTIYVMNRSGDPATQEICDTVYNYIMRPNDPYQRLAPVNATLVVDTPTSVQIYLSATVVLGTAGTIATVKADLLTGVQAYLPEAMEDGVIRLSRIGAILSDIAGVEDYSLLKIGRTAGTVAASNITLSATEYPQTAAGNITLTEG